MAWTIDLSGLCQAHFPTMGRPRKAAEIIGREQMRATPGGALALIMALQAGNVMAEGNLASTPVTLEPLMLDGAEWTMAPLEYTLETGKYYRWAITGDGLEEFAVMSPELWRNSWINQIVINDLEVKPMGLYSVEFDDEGTIEIWFVPIRPGRYDFWVPGYEGRGMLGHFMVN
jgi:hypothetical protein